MNRHKSMSSINPFFSSEDGHFHRLINLHESAADEWEKLKAEIPSLPRGWFELARLSQEERREFTRDFWLSKLPFSSVSPSLEENYRLFFEELEDVSVFASQSTPQSTFEVHMVYTLKDHKAHFHGFPPASSEAIQTFCKQFRQFMIPSDYLAFLEIHDGFSSYHDRGILALKEMAKTSVRFQDTFQELLFAGPEQEPIHPAHLLPFYESSRLNSFQCFCADWYPTPEMGNIRCEEGSSPEEFYDEIAVDPRYAFPTFLHWLLFYLKDSE